MPFVDVVNINNEKVGQVELPDSIYQVAIQPHLVREVVVSQLNNRRAGTACAKTRAEVAYSNRKPFPQKKTGRARAGSRRSPLLRGGGTIFGPKPRDYYTRPPAKVRRQALKIALSSKLKQEDLIILDNLTQSEIKSKTFSLNMKSLGLKEALVITAVIDHNLEMSSRNFKSFKVLRVEGLNCYDILRYRKLVVTQDCLPLIETRLVKISAPITLNSGPASD
ncbi:MAG: 50S ribosomal protein L4 [Deltaproteobacteria bacterium]|jgi:large subunit ribosomal protein L4|nr:50S ribosomal protein L4 [Deltaproteobacteria bacterium]